MIGAMLLALSLSAQPAGRVEPFPGVVVDFDARAVELTGSVPIDAHQPETPEVPIEVIAAAGDTREHEALIRISASSRELHAALLLLGLEPGAPGLILSDGSRADPTGPQITLLVRFDRNGRAHAEDPASWVVDDESGERLSDLGVSFVFAGSGERVFQGQSVYLADAEGVAVGLCTFGAGRPGEAVGVETVGMLPVFSPDSGSGDRLWHADPARTPAFGTGVTLVLTAPPEAQTPSEPAAAPGSAPEPE